MRNLALRLGRLRPSRLLAQRREQILLERKRLRDQVRNRLRSIRQHCDDLKARPPAPPRSRAKSSPAISITMDARTTAKSIRTARETRAGQKLKTRLHAGEVRSVVEKKS